MKMISTELRNENTPLSPLSKDDTEAEKLVPVTKKTQSLRPSLTRIRSSIYFKDDTHGWLPGEIIEMDEVNGTATVILSPKLSTSSLAADTKVAEDEKEEKLQGIKIKLENYGPSQSLPLQCLDHHGSTIIEQDLRDLPYSNEASILYNLKERYETQQMPYTRATKDVMVAINPYLWIDGIYSNEMRRKYADEIVWKGSSKALPPHIYEISSLALKGILTDSNDQTIVVSGESGSGKTVSSKLLMTHLATFQDEQHAYSKNSQLDGNNNRVEDTSDNDDKTKKNKKRFSRRSKKKSESAVETEKSTIQNSESNYHDLKVNTVSQAETHDSVFQPDNEQANIIVQRVIDSNPLLEAFGNAKTKLNHNSSRFSRYSKLQFSLEKGIFHPIAKIAGSACHTFLLEKSRVVSHDSDNNERTFHIFYQFFAATDEEKGAIWDHLRGKDTSSFKYIGYNSRSDEFTDIHAWNNTKAALETIGVNGDDLKSLLTAFCTVLQLGNIMFGPNPMNDEEAVITNEDELNLLSDIIGISTTNLSYCLTHKTVKTSHETFKIPLKVEDAKSTCDAFAKECYRSLFDWLVNKVNDSTCAERNTMNGSKRYRSISVLDICGFECFDTNGFEQLLINHTNERLQKTFTETVIDSVIEEYVEEGLAIENLQHEDNQAIIEFLEGPIGLMSLLNEECIRPKGSDAGFVNKVYATHRSDVPSSKLFFRRNYQLAKHSKCMFGVKHFAKDVTYDATGFLLKNKDTLSYDVIRHAITSTNEIVRDGLKFHESSTPKKQKALTGTSLWTSFERQMNSLFSQIKETKSWYVRCLIPNKQNIPFCFDLKCTLGQLRSVGLLTALKMSNALFPNKLRFEYVLSRFWYLGKFQKKYSFGKMDKHDMPTLRKDSEFLMLKVFPQTEEKIDKLFFIGRTKVYFRAGALETLEAERVKIFDISAMKIQARVRGVLSRRTYMILLRKKVTVDTSCRRCSIQ